MPPKYILPQELARPPIEETVFEVRFGAQKDGDPARIYALLRGALGTAYPRSEAVPTTRAPEHFRSASADPRYEPKLQLMGDGGFVFIGDCVVRLRLVGAYPGWEAVRAKLDAVLDALAETKLAGPIERISLKFVNVLRDPPPRQLEALRVDFRVNKEAVPEIGLHVRMELSDERYQRVVEIQPGGPLGLMLSLDCRRDLLGEEFWPQRSAVLENLHFELRALFFRLLTREAMEKLGPIYRDAPEHDGPTK